MIKGVAVRNDFFILKLPIPNRHCDCMKYLTDVLGIDPANPALNLTGDNQGFYTDAGEYLTRKEALEYVNNDETNDININRDQLYSEDLW